MFDAKMVRMSFGHLCPGMMDTQGFEGSFTIKGSLELRVILCGKSILRWLTDLESLDSRGFQQAFKNKAGTLQKHFNAIISSCR
jgi:hypothetical protein